MTSHNPRLDVGTNQSTITCSCGQFTKTTAKGNRTQREEHLEAEHRQHVKDAT